MYGRDNLQDSTVADLAMEEAFNADEIDDPFTTAYDKEVAEKDIPERLQIKLKDRMNPTNEELIEESHWILDRLCNYRSVTMTNQGSATSGTYETSFNYQRLPR